MLPLAVVASLLPSFCLLVAHSFVQLLLFVQLKRQGEQGTEPVQLKISPMMAFLFFHGKNKPQNLCLWSCEYVCLFSFIFFFLIPHGQELFTWRISGKNPALILSSGISFLLALSINEFCFCIQCFFCPLQRLMPQSCHRWFLFFWSCCYSSTVSWTCLPSPFFPLCIAVAIYVLFSSNYYC